MAALIVGDRRDSHVVAVLAAVRRLGMPPAVVLDAPTLEREGFTVDLDEATAGGSTCRLNDAGTGWLRRYAPSGWGTGTVAGSLDAVTRRAFLGLIGSVTRLGNRRWLTPLDELLNAEDRLVQLETARSLGWRIPRTVVTSDAREAIQRLGPGFVVKPIAGGYYWTEGGPRAVFASEFSAESATEVDFGAAPFVAQERIVAIEHLRVVTVGDEAWVANLSARDRPLDWRRQNEAHFEWQPVNADDARIAALTLATALHIGYSSQDWVRDERGLVFLDLNPGGQWLFLPPPVAEPVTASIAQFLCAERT